MTASRVFSKDGVLHTQVAASLPVGIPWSAQLPASRGVERQRAPVVRGHTSDIGETRDSVHIAASIPVSNIAGHLCRLFTRSKQGLTKHD